MVAGFAGNIQMREYTRAETNFASSSPYSCCRGDARGFTYDQFTDISILVSFHPFPRGCTINMELYQRGERTEGVTRLCLVPQKAYDAFPDGISGFALDFHCGLHSGSYGQEHRLVSTLCVPSRKRSLFVFQGNCFPCCSSIRVRLQLPNHRFR